MESFPPLEKAKILNTKNHLKAKKISFQINEYLLPKGLTKTFGVINHPGAALAVPITNDGLIIVLRQYRFAISRRILEFPAGTLEENENPLSSIKRELQEESGYSASKWDELGVMHPCPGYSDEVIHLFLARDIEKMKIKPLQDEDEDIEVLLMKKDELESAINSNNELLDGKTITAWHRACRFLNNN